MSTQQFTASLKGRSDCVISLWLLVCNYVVCALLTADVAQGFLFAIATFGYFDATKYRKEMSRTNNMVAPEHRLYSALFGCWLVPIGLFVSKSNKELLIAALHSSSLFNLMPVVRLDTSTICSLDCTRASRLSIWLGHTR